ncbi:MAG: zinc-dependent metalloprotease family protein [Planctomycetota bacterium]
MRLSSCSLLALAVLAAPAAAQRPTAIDAPGLILDELRLSGGTVQRLALPPDGQPAFSVQLELAGTRRTLDLHAHDLRAPDFALMAPGLDGQWRPIDTPPPTTYRGTVRGLADSRVAVSLLAGQLAGSIHMGDALWAVQPATDAAAYLPRTAHVVYSTADLLPFLDRCAADQLAHPQATTDAPAPRAPAGEAPDGAASIAEIAFELTPAYRAKFGSTQEAMNAVETAMNSLDLIYRRDADIGYTITRMVASGRDYTTGPIGTIITATLIWNIYAASIPRDVTQIMMGDPTTGTAGIAFISSVCTGLGYSVVWDYDSELTRLIIMTHELGHNWSSQHCAGPECAIMCPSVCGCALGCTQQFSAVSIASIVRFRDTRTCLQ